MTIKEVTNYLEDIAPLAHQESYDNSGLIVGNQNNKVSGVLICLDSIEDVVDEAISKECNLIIAHHPIVFSGLKKITGKNYIERVIIKAIKNDIAIYAIHTNLDNVINGVNSMFADKLELTNRKILRPAKNKLKKLVTFVPYVAVEKVTDGLFHAGAGHIGSYSECSFSSKGEGSFKPQEGTNPFVGEINSRHIEPEHRLEVIFPSSIEKKLIDNLNKFHPYEEVAFDIYDVTNEHPNIGAGIIGDLEKEIDPMSFLLDVKEKMKTDCIRYTSIGAKKQIKKVAICGGSGSFLLPDALREKADIFITGDFKYHQFFDADNQIIIADIGHYESEQFTIELLATQLKEKFTNFAIHLTEVNTNPINYL